MDTQKTAEGEAFDHLKEAFNILSGITGTRALSIAITQLETSIMWLNKHRTDKGEFSPTKTHVTKAKKRVPEHTRRFKDGSKLEYFKNGIRYFGNKGELLMEINALN